MLLKRRAPSSGGAEWGPLAQLSRHRGLAMGFGLAVLALGLLVSQTERHAAAPHPFGLAGAPAQSAVSSLTGTVGNVAERYLLLAGAQREAEQLRGEVADLRRELAAVDELALENRRLKTLLAFKESTDLPMLPARVVGRNASAWFRTLVVDKGADDGVSLNSPVVTAEGVIGRIYQVSSSASRVLLLTDTSSAVDAVVQRTRAQVVVEGRLGPVARILYLARTDEAAPGDRVVTSGLDGIYPKGLVIGQIVRVETSKGGVFRGAELVPAVDFSRLEEVFVVLPRSGAPRG